jgi:2-oxoglutarate dehydrogenase complex dihydrolipoamide succinyltransferase (E2) component
LVYEFKLPDLGEGVAEGEVLKWMVKEGESVKEDQPLVEVMTDKVNVQIPAPRTGTISKILAKEGDIAKVGQTIVVIDDGSAPPATPPTPLPAPQQAPSLPPQSPPITPSLDILATPATRRLARELGVEIGAVRGSGTQGRITDDDVRRAASPPPRTVAQAPVVEAQEQRAPPQEPRIPPQAPAAPAQGSKEEVVPLRGMRRTIAEHMAKSKQMVAQVTHVDEADLTDLVLLREAFKGSAAKRGVRLTFLPFIIKALVPALKEFPYVNSSLDEASGNIILKKYYNIGVATDTSQGLVVPVIRDVDSKDIFDLAGEIEKVAVRAREGQLTLEDVKGSTFTVTNVGAIGGLFATPIVNYPEVAILGLHKIAKRPVVRGGRVEVRDMTYLSLSFDHRVFDGAYAARFATRVIEILQDTKKLLAEVV